MGEMVQIRSVKQYFNDFVVKGLEGKTRAGELDLIPIKQKILNAFKKEIFEQIYFKLGDSAKTMTRDDLAKIETVNNILTQEFRKWRRLCILCGEYGLGSFFQLEDLKKVLEEEEPDPDEVVEMPAFAEEEDVTDNLDEILPEGEAPVYLNGGLQVAEPTETFNKEEKTDD